LAAGYFDSVHPLPEVCACLLLHTCCRNFIGFQLYLSLYGLLF
jgi:hypothetical protein